MTKISDARRPVSDMSGFVSPRVQKGVRYLDGADKAKFQVRIKKVFAKVKVPAAT